MVKVRAVMIATTIGTILQVAMVVAGHSNKSVANLFAVGGMGISLLAGLMYTWSAGRSPTAHLAIGGLIAGGACAFIGIFVSYRYGDVPASLLALGTVSSMITGALGGWLGKFMMKSVAAVVAMVALAPTANSDVASAHTSSAVAAPTPSTIGIRATPAASATIADFAWLAGKWEGTLDSGVGTAYIVYAEPHAGFMTGVNLQRTKALSDQLRASQRSEHSRLQNV